MCRRYIAAAVTVFVLSVLLCGCGQSGEKKEGTRITTLTMVKPKGMKGFAEAAESYERSHSGVQIQIIDIADSTNEMYKVYMASLSGRDSDIDIMLLDEIWVDEMESYGYLEPLGYEIDEREYDPLALDFFSVDGKMYAQPFAFDVGAVFYRKDRTAKPKNWNDVFGGAAESPVFEKSVDEDLLCTAIELGDDMERAKPYFGDSGENSGDIKTKFKNGEINYCRGWSKDYTYFNDYDFDIGGNVGVMIPEHPVVGGYGLAVSSFSQHKETAFDFIFYLTNSYNIRELLKREGYIPVQREYLDDEMFADYNPCAAEIRETLSRAAVRQCGKTYVKDAWDLQQEIYDSICGNGKMPALEKIYKIQGGR